MVLPRRPEISISVIFVCFCRNSCLPACLWGASAHDGWAMQKRRLIFLVIAGVVLVGVLVVAWNRNREPEYGGKRLSEWVDGYVTPGRRAESDAAIRQIGTNALPFLLNLVRYQTPTWKIKLYGVINPTLKRFHLNWELTDDKQQRRSDSASSGLRALGPNAEVTIPEISRLLNDPQGDWRVAARAKHALRGLGKAGLPSLIGALTNRHLWTFYQVENRRHIARLIGQMGPEGTPAIPALQQLQREDTGKPRDDWKLRDAATNALRNIDPGALERAETWIH